MRWGGLSEELAPNSGWRGFLFEGDFPIVFSAIMVWMVGARTGFNHDSALFLYCGRLILDGALPYVDFVEINPPLIMYISVLPVMLSAVAGSQGELLGAAFATCVSFLFAFSLLGTSVALKRCHKSVPSIMRTLFLGSAFGLTFGFLMTPEVNFGQREHLFVMFYLPYFFLRAGRVDGGTIHPLFGATFGIAAATGACLKPHFVLIVLAVELFLLVSRRNFRSLMNAEFLALAASGLAYAIHFLFLPSAMREALFERWLPMIVKGYGAYDVPMAELFRSPSIYIALVLAGACSAIATRSAIPGRKLIGPLIVFTMASCFTYFLEHKGWAYHLIPVWFGSTLLAVFVAVALLSRLIPKAFSPVEGEEKLLRIHVWTAVATFVFVFLMMLASFVPASARTEGNPDLVHYILKSLFKSEDLLSGVPVVIDPSRDPVLIISTSVAEVFPGVVDLDLEIASRYLWTFPIALLYADAPDYPEGFPYHAMDESPPEELQFLQELGDDIVNNAPKVIVMDYAGQAQGCPVGFNPADYLRVNGFIGRYMTNYKAPRDIMGKKVYYRKDIAG